MNDLTLIIPAKNEKECLPMVIEQIKNFDFKINVTLKKNDLETIESIKNYHNVNIFYQSGNGYGNALKEAIISCQTKYFCIFNADGSFNPKDLEAMYDLMESNDFVYTTRYENPGGSDDDTYVTYLGNKIFSKLGNFFFSLSLSDILYTYIMGRTESFKKLNITANDFRFCVELPIKMQISEMKYKCIPSYENKRIAGRKKVKAFKDGLLILIEMVKLFLIFKLFRKKIISK